MSLLEKIASHYDSNRDHSIEIEEWETTVYYTSLTVAERNKIIPLMNKKDEPLTWMIELIIMKAKDENGNPLFPNKIDAKNTFKRKADLAPISRLANAITAPLKDGELGEQ